MAITVKDSSNAVQAIKTSIVGGQHIIHHNIDVCALPTGAATQATLASLLSAVQNQGNLTTPQPVVITGSGVMEQILGELEAISKTTDTQPVSVASSVLPTGAATESTLQTISQGIPLTPTAQSIILYVSSGNVATTDPVTIAAAVPGTTHSLLGLTVSNAGNPTWVKFQSNSTLLYTVFATSGSPTVFAPGIAWPLAGNDGEDLRFVCESVAAVRVSAQYLSN